MAIPAQPALQLPALTPLTPSGQLVWGPGDVQEPAIVATVTFTGDGATTTAVVNWIDGTLSLPFTPRVVLAFAYPGGTAAATISIQQQVAVTSTGATLTFSTAPANAATITVLLLLFK